MDNRTRQTLELFVEKAERLNTLSFTSHVVQRGVGMNVSWSAGEAVQVNINNPNAEATDAFITTFRMFIQNNDDISFNNISKLIGKDPSLSENWKEQYLDVRQKVNATLDRPSMCAIEIDKKGVRVRSTCRDIMDTFIYGEYAHTTEDKRLLYQEWKRNAFFFQFVENEFKSILVDVLNAIFYVSDLNKLELTGQPIPALPPLEEVEL